jgi:hypothetical protein
MRMKRSTAYFGASMFMLAILMGWVSFLYYMDFFKAI